MQEQAEKKQKSAADKQVWQLPVRAIRIVSMACSRLYRARSALQYVRVEAEGDECLVVGSDGRKLLVSRYTPWKEGLGPLKRVCTNLHRRIASSLSSVSTVSWACVDESGKAAIGFGGDDASAMLIVENIGSKYPDWRMVLNRFGGKIPQQKLAGAIKVDMRRLIELLQPMVKLSEDNLDSDPQQYYCYVSIDLEAGQLTIQSRDLQDLGILMGAKEADES